LVVENRVPVIPVKIEGTFGVLPRGNFFPRLGQRVTIKLGQPFYAHEILADAREENAYYMYKKVADALRQRIIAL
jgi:1-acyl-sn-glycerol-3-phosphate acyltransferase